MDSSAHELSPEEKLAEKSRLKDVLKTFTRKALRGVSCRGGLVSPSSCGVPRKSSYSLNKAVTRFILEPTVEAADGGSGGQRGGGDPQLLEKLEMPEAWG